MMRAVILIACAAVVFFLPKSIGPVVPVPEPGSDEVRKAFDTYEVLWLDVVTSAAQALEDGELTTDTAIRDFIAAGGKAARRTAFQPLADSEQAQLQPWDAETHARILRSYSR